MAHFNQYPIVLVSSDTPTGYWLNSHNNRILIHSDQHLQNLLPSGNWVQILVISSEKAIVNQLGYSEETGLAKATASNTLYRILAQSGNELKEPNPYLLLNLFNLEKVLPQIPEEFIRTYIKSWNSGNCIKTVSVESDVITPDNSGNSDSFVVFKRSITKINTDNTISIKIPDITETTVHHSNQGMEGGKLHPIIVAGNPGFGKSMPFLLKNDIPVVKDFKKEPVSEELNNQFIEPFLIKAPFIDELHKTISAQESAFIKIRKKFNKNKFIKK